MVSLLIPALSQQVSVLLVYVSCCLLVYVLCALLFMCLCIAPCYTDDCTFGAGFGLAVRALPLRHGAVSASVLLHETVRT